MKKALPWIITLAATALVAAFAFRPESSAGLHWREFGALPVLVNGRVKPLDTVARTSLLTLHDKQTLRLEGGTSKLTAIEWLAELCFAPARADERKVFVIHDPQVLGMFGWQTDGEKDFSLAQIAPHFDEIINQARLAGQVDESDRSMFQRHILQLYSKVETYQRLKNSLQTEDAHNFADELAQFERAVAPLAKLVAMRTAGQTLSPQDTETLATVEDRYARMAEFGSLRVVPPADSSGTSVSAPGVWETVGASLVRALHDGQVHPVAKAYAAIGAAYRADDAAAFNTAVGSLKDWMQTDHAAQMQRTARETFFNRLEPFYLAMMIYVAVFIIACVSWLTGPGAVGRTAFLLTGLALAIHTIGIAFRMYLEARPPVTNLYSSAVFVGWAAVLLAFILERIYRNGFGSVVAGIFGFLTLVVAHNLALISGGDTMEAMRAVLDNNFWLATHVVAITVGYSATFLAGFLAIVYILMGVFTTWLGKQFSASPAVSTAAGTPATTKPTGETNARALSRMTYGIVCFATLFSFVGTVLGGIWADQSWGRFWGWDPKENGAALIVLWNAIILHARWGGYIRDRGLMVLAVGGNIVTAWSWFGVNMLSKGLHSYGFMESAFPALVGFWISQIAIMVIGGLPFEMWRSPMTPARSTPSPEPPAGRAARASAGT